MASASYRGLRVHNRLVYTAGLLTADYTVHDEIPGVIARSAQLSGVGGLNFLTKTPASVFCPAAYFVVGAGFSQPS